MPNLSARVALRAHLDQVGTVYALHADTLEVQGDVVLLRGGLAAHMAELPDGLRITGDLIVNSHVLGHLPDRLVVLGQIVLSHSGIIGLPQDLEVGRSLRLDHSQVRALPTGLRVHKVLDLTNTRIDRLPEGLYVGGDLMLERTRITRLPRSLHVGGIILPPSGLEDFTGFMATRPNELTLHAPGSYHERMHMQAWRDTWPDLFQVMDHLPAGGSLHLRRQDLEEIQATVRLAPVS